MLVRPNKPLPGQSGRQPHAETVARQQKNTAQPQQQPEEPDEARAMKELLRSLVGALHPFVSQPQARWRDASSAPLHTPSAAGPAPGRLQGHTKYDPRVVHVLIDQTFRYASDLLEEAEVGAAWLSLGASDTKPAACRRPGRFRVCQRLASSAKSTRHAPSPSTCVINLWPVVT